MTAMTDEELRAELRTWFDKAAMPADMQRSLWDEFYAFQQRRDQWRAFREMADASDEDAKKLARYLVQWAFRNHVEAQAAALRRFAYSGPDARPMSFGRMLRLVSERPTVYGQDASDKATADLADLRTKVEAVDRFASKWVAHLDRDHDTGPLTLADMDGVVESLGPMWTDWYLQVTGHSTSATLPPTGAWADDLRLVRSPTSQSKEPRP